MTIPLAILTLTILVSAVLCHTIAKQRGAKPVFWGVMGLLFGPLAIPFVLMAKPATNKQD